MTASDSFDSSSLYSSEDASSIQTAEFEQEPTISKGSRFKPSWNNAVPVKVDTNYLHEFNRYPTVRRRSEISILKLEDVMEKLELQMAGHDVMSPVSEPPTPFSDFIVSEFLVSDYDKDNDEKEKARPDSATDLIPSISIQHGPDTQSEPLVGRIRQIKRVDDVSGKTTKILELSLGVGADKPKFTQTAAFEAHRGAFDEGRPMTPIDGRRKSFLHRVSHFFKQDKRASKV